MIEDKNDFLESDSLQIKIKEKLSIFLTENQYPLKSNHNLIRK